MVIVVEYDVGMVIVSGSVRLHVSTTDVNLGIGIGMCNEIGIVIVRASVSVYVLSEIGIDMFITSVIVFVIASASDVGSSTVRGVGRASVTEIGSRIVIVVIGSLLIVILSVAL